MKTDIKGKCTACNKNKAVAIFDKRLLCSRCYTFIKNNNEDLLEEYLAYRERK